MTGLMISAYLLGWVFLKSAAAVGTMAAVSWLNRVAGGGYIVRPTGKEGDWLLKRWLPGKPLYWIAPAVGLLAWPWLGWREAAALVFGYFVWRLLPWGRWLAMDRLPIGWGRTEPPSTFERCIEAVSFGSGRLAMFWRFLVTSPAILPLAWVSDISTLAMSVSAPVSAIALWLAYEAGWRVSPNDGVPTAEHIAGALWGVLIVFLALWGPGTGPITGGGF